MILYSHSHRGFSPVIKAFPDSSNRFNGLKFRTAQWKRKTVETVIGILAL
jgi:hypothetical protein